MEAGASLCIASTMDLGQAAAYDARQERKIRKTFPNRTAGRRWRQDPIVALRAGTLAESKPKTTMRV